MVAITLHWVIAAAILLNLGIGLWMVWAIDSSELQAGAVSAFQLHKSIGLAVLVLSLIRLAWRLLYPPPPLPVAARGWERALAAITHWLFYGLMIGLPLSGWLYVSAQWRGAAPFNIPTLWFGLFEVPHLFGLGDSSAALRQQVAAISLNVHGAMVLALILLLVLHVAAALKHHFLQRDGILARMLPWLAVSGAKASGLQRPTASSLAAAVTVLLLAVLLLFYGVTARLVPVEITEPGSLSGKLQQLVGESGVTARGWQVAADISHIRFEGVHAGRTFKGHFAEWQAAIHLDTQRPEKSFIAAVVATASASDGVPLHDRSLPQSEWFDVASHPYATYHSTAIEPVGDNRHAVNGILTIKGHAVELAPLMLVIDGDELTLEGSVEVDRTVVDLGMESDPGGQYVSRIIKVHVAVRAAR